MARINKYIYYYVIQGNYGYYGFEDACFETDYKEARKRLKEHRENMPKYAHRLIKRRELNEEFKK